MKKIIVAFTVLIAVAAWAQIENSNMYLEYVRRDAVNFTGFESAVLSRLQFSGVDPKTITLISGDDSKQTFQFETNKDEVCNGQVVAKKTQYTCASKWSGESAKIIAAIYTSIPKEKIVDIEIFPEANKYVFQTVDREICHGDFYFGKAQFSCFTKAGVTSFFAGGDND